MTEFFGNKTRSYDDQAARFEKDFRKPMAPRPKQSEKVLEMRENKIKESGKCKR